MGIDKISEVPPKKLFCLSAGGGDGAGAGPLSCPEPSDGMRLTTAPQGGGWGSTSGGPPEEGAATPSENTYFSGIDCIDSRTYAISGQPTASLTIRGGARSADAANMCT